MLPVLFSFYFISFILFVFLPLLICVHSIWQTLIEKLLADEALPVTIDKIAGPVLPCPKSTYTETKFNFETCILNF
jgi:hypothetical protein